MGISPKNFSVEFMNLLNVLGNLSKSPGPETSLCIERKGHIYVVYKDI